MMTTDAPFFSVVIPVYNSETYLDECIGSIFAQTCQDFEVVLVDDESKDKSAEICDTWAEKYPDKVRVIHQKNTGVYIAKRNGIKASKGKYIYVIDNDDLITSAEAFQTVKDTVLRENCDLVIFNATDNVETGHLLCNIPFKDREVFEGERLSIIYDEYLKTKNLHHIWMMMFKRELFDWDYEYREEHRMLRDGPFLIIPIISNASKIIYLKDVFYYWRVQNQNSASKHYDVVNFYKSVKCLHSRIKECSKKWKYRSDETKSLLKSNYVTDICIAAIKVRSIAENAGMSRLQFIKTLSADETFRKCYSLKNLGTQKKLVAFLLFHRQYHAVNALSSLVGLAKRR